MKSILPFLYAFLIMAFLTASKLEKQEANQLTFGTASGYAPFVSLTSDGKYEGFDIDICKAIAKKLNKELIIKDFGSMPSLILALKQGKAEAIIWAISMTAERMQEIELIHYQGERETALPFLFWKKVPKGIKQIEDLEIEKKKPICIEAGTSQEAILRNYPSLNLKNVDKITDAIMDVKYGKSVAVAVDPALVTTLRTQNPELKLKELPVPSHLQVLGLGIGITKQNTQLINEVRETVTELKKEGTILELEKKWNLVK